MAGGLAGSAWPGSAGKPQILRVKLLAAVKVLMLNHIHIVRMDVLNKVCNHTNAVMINLDDHVMGDRVVASRRVGCGVLDDLVRLVSGFEIEVIVILVVLTIGDRRGI